eukprot:TRINITY_DN11235_c0_g1_i4.p1 TRINITY_DN11235_c0_g1~~TRINITY_DN11235_c0_g1_i4.p1  ORF type:complete len:347 (+),score=63.99 TRINITY_DN11235_c0_g1_i4:94-1134(+)
MGVIQLRNPMLSRGLRKLTTGVSPSNFSMLTPLMRAFAEKANEGKDGKKKDGKAASKAAPSDTEAVEDTANQPKSRRRPADLEKAAALESKIRDRIMDAFEKQYSFVVTTDMCRLDFGYFISRPPIFITYTDEEMKLRRTRYLMMKKYKMFMSYTKELMDFPRKYPNDMMYMSASDNDYTHEKTDPNTGVRVRYHQNSKFFKNVDPTIYDHHSIQHNSAMKVYLLVKSKEDNKWTWPTFIVKPRYTLQEAHDSHFTRIVDSGSFYQITHGPIYNTFRELNAEEKKDPEYKKVRGVRTYYFPLYHTTGRIILEPARYSDFSWVARTEANKFFTREDYERYIQLMLPY